MKNIKKKFSIILLLLIILIANFSLANYSTVKMEVVEEPICSIPLGPNAGFEKKLISKDLTNKEVTIQLQVSNNEKTFKPTGELVLLIDNSKSMELDVSKGKTRKDLIYNSAKTLLSNLTKENDQLKVGIVSFSSNVDQSKEGSIEDAKLEVPLISNFDKLSQGLSTIQANGHRTNLDAGLKLANQQFTTEKNNKYLVILTDGIPNIAVNYDKHYYSDDVINKTNTQLKELGNNNINVITMLSGITDPDNIPVGVSKTQSQIIEEIFGTPTAPTTGKFYYVTDQDIEKTITTDIYNALVPVSKSYKNIKVVDYFPKEIIDNFEFAYVSNANIREISAEVDKTNNSITWTIPELKSGETATVQYKLKLKENFDANIVDKILNTNQKVDISYTDFDNKTENKTSDVSPKLKLTEPPVELPKAGTTTLFIILGSIAILSIGYTVIKLNKYKNI